uniref:Uncharacterized protein n=1 Tax=Panagrolaimus sp. ES5 TaxID=591445 RepID=A0AC34FCV8_9BILA
MEVDVAADEVFVDDDEEIDPLQKAKNGVEELWKPAYSKFTSDKIRSGIKSDEDYRGIVGAIKNKARGDTFTRNERQEYNWSERYTRKRVDGKKQLMRNEKIVLSDSKLFNVIYSKHIENMGKVSERFIFSGAKRCVEDRFFQPECVLKMIKNVFNWLIMI